MDGKTNARSDSKVDQRESLCRYFEDALGNATQWHDPASCDTGSEGKRAKGVEPSTFTLAKIPASSGKQFENIGATSESPGRRRISAVCPLTGLFADQSLDELVGLRMSLSQNTKLALLDVIRDVLCGRWKVGTE